MKFAILAVIFLFSVVANAQTWKRDFTVGEHPRVEIENRFGQVRITTDEKLIDKVVVEATSPKSDDSDSGSIADNNFTIVMAAPGKFSLRVNQTKKRIDLILHVPIRSRLNIAGEDGTVEVAGSFETVEIATGTGTIFADVPIDHLRFDFLWTESRPRYLSDFKIPEPKEKAGGKFTISGKIPNQKSEKSKEENKQSQKKSNDSVRDPVPDNENLETENQNSKTKHQKNNDKSVTLSFKTRRGVIVLNVPPSQVPSDLRERPLTNAAKAVVSSGDSILSEAIRRASPKYFGDYLKTLPDRRRTPNIVSRETINENKETQVEVLRRLNLSVTDRNGRAINNLKADDFVLLENGAAREIVEVEPTTAPFNLILLLDVSGSVEERIDFIRKAARNFVNTVAPNDKLAIITFRDDVQIVSNFTFDKNVLSQRLDDFDAGGGTALYDSIAFVLAETLRPLKGERTAIVILSDGDDNRSFIPFEPLLGAIEESGALVYPLYVPSGLIPQNNQPTADETLDPLRARFLALTTKAEAEGQKLAEVSGGRYFPIRRLEDLQTAYDDVVAQLRTAYSLTYRSKSASETRPRISVKRADTYIRAGTLTEIKN